MSAGLELLRLRRSRRPWVAAFSLAFFLAMMLLGFYTYAQNRTGGSADFRYTFENRSYFNGLTFAIYAFYFGFLLVLPIFVATEGGAQIAGETAAGTLRLYLSRPITRAKLFVTKLGVAFLYSGAMAGVFLGVSLAIGLFTVGWGDLDLYPGVLQMTDRHQHLDQDVALRRFALAWPAASLALLTPLSMSLWISAWSKSAVNAVGTSVALYLVLYVIAEIPFFTDLRPWLFTSYMPYWRSLFREEIPWGEVVRDAARLLGYACLFLGLAFRRFRRREES